MRSDASVPAPVMPLPLRTATLPVRFAFFCVPSSFVLECVWPLPVVASTVFDISSTMSSSVGGRPWLTRVIIFFHSSTLLISYQTSLMYLDVVGSMAE